MSTTGTSDGRRRRLREWAVSLVLRLSKHHIGAQKRTIAVVGDHIGDQIRARGIYERDQLEFLRDRVLDLDLCRRQTALDVGANIGNHSMFFADLFAKVIAFEPNPIASGILKLNLQLNDIGNVEVRPYGLSDRSASAQLNIPDDNIGAATIADEGSSPFDKAETISLVRGDDALEGDHSIGLIKIDVEGAEAAVLEGLRGTISRHQPIIILEQLANAIDASTGQSPAFTLLRELRYEAWELRGASRTSGIAGKIGLLLLGNSELRAVPVSQLQSRDYPALLFRPSGE